MTMKDLQNLAVQYQRLVNALQKCSSLFRSHLLDSFFGFNPKYNQIEFFANTKPAFVTLTKWALAAGELKKPTFPGGPYTGLGVLAGRKYEVNIWPWFEGAVCERIQVGEKEVPAHTEPIYETRCKDYLELIK